MQKSIDDLLREYEGQQESVVTVETTAHASDEAFECCVYTCCLGCVSI